NVVIKPDLFFVKGSNDRIGRRIKPQDRQLVGDPFFNSTHELLERNYRVPPDDSHVRTRRRDRLTAHGRAGNFAISFQVPLLFSLLIIGRVAISVLLGLGGRSQGNNREKGKNKD